MKTKGNEFEDYFLKRGMSANCWHRLHLLVKLRAFVECWPIVVDSHHFGG